MAMYAYCMLRLSADENWPVMQGINGQPVFPLRCGKYAMLLSRMNRSFQFSARSIIEHGQVIGRAFETHTVLPMRFGTFFGSEQQIARLIRENQRDLLETFCRLRGKAEMRVKLTLPLQSDSAGAVKKSPQRVRPRNGSVEVSRPVLDSRHEQMVQALDAQMLEIFQPLERQISCRLVQGGQPNELMVEVSHLIEGEKVASYQRLGAVAAERLKECELRLTGPWPPYHFLPSSVRLPAPVTPVLRARPALAPAVLAAAAAGAR